MVGYLTNDWYTRIELTLGNIYLNYLYEDALMAVVLGYRKSLFDKLRRYSLPNEWYNLNILERSYPLHIYIKNGNLVIKN